MKPYHKIPTVFKRDPTTENKTLLLDKYATPEIEYLWNCWWTFTEKVDGTNIRVVSLPSGDICFCGRTDRANIPAKLTNRLRELFPHHERLHEQFPDGACLYGEGFGAGIQKGGGNYQATQEFVLFDIRVGNWWLEQEAIREIAKKLELKVVPIIGAGNLEDMMHNVECGFSSVWGPFQAEGIVARPDVELFGRNGERVICKLKTKDFT